MAEPAVVVPAQAQPVADRSRSRWLVAGLLLVLAFGVGARLVCRSALWLDEAISVSISSLPLGHLQEALRQDGAPPVYPLLLWLWERLVGTSPAAVRALSAVFGIAALPVAALAGRRLAGRVGAVAAVVLLATSPFAIYYSSEARMYSLVVLLVLSGFLLLDDYLRDPRPRRGVLVALLSGTLALTHYWALFLLAVVAVALLVRSRVAQRPVDRHAVGWLAAGGLLFLPWLPSFLFQTAHTGTPWARPAPISALLSSVQEWAGGPNTPAPLLGFALLLLALAGATAARAGGSLLMVDLRGRPPGRALAVTWVGTMLLGLAVGRLTGAAFASRYSSVAFPVFLLLTAVGLARLPRRAQAPLLALLAAAGIAVTVPHLTSGTKTQAPVLAAALRASAQPGDVVVYCPDQLGPSTSRLLPPSLVQEVYPTGDSPARVDWVDYAKRNAEADPVAFARGVTAQAAGYGIWLVAQDGYRTYDHQCSALSRALTALRGTPVPLVRSGRRYFERASLVGWPAR